MPGTAGGGAPGATTAATAGLAPVMGTYTEREGEQCVHRVNTWRGRLGAAERARQLKHDDAQSACRKDPAHAPAAHRGPRRCCRGGGVAGGGGHSGDVMDAGLLSGEVR